MTQQYDLPPLPEPFTYTRPGLSEGPLFHKGHMQAYARAAIDAARKEPIMTDLLTRLRQLARAEHSDLSVADEAAEEIESLREDAIRYRWLRDGGNDDMGVVRGFDCIDTGSTSVAGIYEEALDGEQLDAAIDHARRVEGEP